MEKSSPEFSHRFAQRQGDYGFDAPYVPVLFLLIGLVMLVVSLLSLLLWQSPIFGIIDLLFGLYMLLSGASYIYTTRRVKFQVWAELLSPLDLRGDEQIFDLGTGRGAVLLMAASLLPRGKATGVDIWKTSDQSGMPVRPPRRMQNGKALPRGSSCIPPTCASFPSPTTLLILFSPVLPSIIFRRAKVDIKPWTKPYAFSNRGAD